jgi:protein SCO1
MSISVDPEEDTPARLREYAQKFHAGPEWQHYTGTQEASLAAQRAFNVFRGEKMNHSPVTFLRLAPGDPWQRIDGFVTPNELLAQYRRLLQQSAPSVATR